jgi:hypothetical protein
LIDTRRLLLLGMLLAPSQAMAWDHEELGPASLPAPVLEVGLVPVEGGHPMVLAMGGQVTWLVDPVEVEDVRTLPIGGRDVALLDVDGNGQRDLLLCGSYGVKAVPWEGHLGGIPVRLTSRYCDAIEVVDSPDGRLVATASEDLTLWAVPGDGTLAERERHDLHFEGRALLAAEGELLAVTAPGATEILEWSPHGQSALATGGPVGGLALGPWGWSWTLPERGLLADMTHRTVPLDGTPGALASGDLDGDGQRDLAVLHPTLGLVTVVFGAGGLHERLQFTETISSIAMGDVDRDGCDDMVVGMSEPPGITVLHTKTCESSPPLAIAGPTRTPPAPPVTMRRSSDPESDGDPDARNRAESGPPLADAYKPPPPTERPPEVLGVEIPWFLGDKAARDAERMRVQQYVIVGSGWAMGGALRNVYLQIPFFPALSVEMEWGGPRLRFFLGGDSAALFLWMTENGGGIHLANVSTGFTFGSPRLRTGPFATGGLLNFGAGWRTVFTPWDDGDTLKGIEVRLTWFYPSTGEVMVLYVWSQPMRQPRTQYTGQGRRRTRTIPPPDPVLSEPEEPSESVEDVASEKREEEEPARIPVATAGRRNPQRRIPGLLACRRFGASVGIAAGGSSTRFSWEYVGSDVPISPSVSPVVAMQCEMGGRGLGLLLGLESAPFYSYLTKEDDRLHHMGSHTLGVMIGGDGFRIGPAASAGIWTLSGGLRAAIRLRVDKQKLTHQLDIRAMVHYPSAPAGQVMLLYGVALDPWK